MSEPTTMRAWRTQEWGQPGEVLKLDTIDIPEPGPGELLVRNLAIPLNLNDMERVTGGNMMVTPELPLVPGMEVMGVVHACGSGVESWQDKRVVAMPKGANGGWAEYSVCPVVSAFDMPEDISLPDAAALYFPFHLAYLGLYDRAALQASETVLIHAAAGGAGSAAIQLAKSIGARVFATVGSEEKRKLCEELGADVVINYTDQDFSEVPNHRVGDNRCAPGATRCATRGAARTDRYGYPSFGLALLPGTPPASPRYRAHPERRRPPGRNARSAGAAPRGSPGP